MSMSGHIQVFYTCIGKPAYRGDGVVWDILYCRVCCWVWWCNCCICYTVLAIM